MMVNPFLKLSLTNNLMRKWSFRSVGDPTAVPDLVGQIETPFDTFMGDGAYDGESVSQAVLDKQPDAQMVIPPHITAVVSVAGDTQRDHQIQTIAQRGRIAWQRITGYNMRNYVALAMQRYKRIFGNTINWLRVISAR